MSENQQRLRDRRKHERGVFERPRGSGVWWVCYFDENGRKHRETVGPKGLAVKVYQKRKTEIAERRFFPERIRRPNVLLKDRMNEYLKRVEGLVRSYRDMKRYAKLWTQELGNLALHQITTSDVERVAAERRKKVSQQTVAHELSFLRRIFNVAIQDGVAERNPVLKVNAPRTHRVRYLVEEEEQQLLEKLETKWHPLIRFAIHTGLRQEEQFSLRWEHVDLANATVRVPRTKSGKARAVPLNDIAKETLRSLPRHLRCPWVFPNQEGTNHLNAHNFVNRIFNPALQEAEIENFRWHDLRHTFASRLAMAGESIQTIAELLGHHSLQMAQRYAHLSPSYLRQAVQRLAVAAPQQKKTKTLE